MSVLKSKLLIPLKSIRTGSEVSRVLLSSTTFQTQGVQNQPLCQLLYSGSQQNVKTSETFLFIGIRDTISLFLHSTNVCFGIITRQPRMVQKDIYWAYTYSHFPMITFLDIIAKEQRITFCSQLTCMINDHNKQCLLPFAL